MTNKELLVKYPFIKLKNVSGEVIEQEDHEDINVEFKDSIYEGWWNRFGLAYLDDFKKFLDENNINYEDVLFLDVKEKYGGLRVYLLGINDDWRQHEYAWEYISEHTCIKCGEFPVPMRRFSWVCPYCDKHAWENKYLKDLTDKEKDELTEKEFDGRLLEYLVISNYSKDKGHSKEFIDMKPYYNSIGWEYINKDLIHKDEMLKMIEESQRDN